MSTHVTLLLIDDKSTNIFALEQLLEKPDRSFLQATDGNEGLRLALNHDVDLIILDVQMPGMDGFEVAHILKSNKRTKDIPIIFASAEKKERQSIIQGFEEGAVDYLPKPLDPELTKAKVAVLLTIQLQKRELIAKNIALQEADARINALNTELKNHLEQLEQANKDLESFSYSVSHDLRAPVRSIIGYATMLAEDLDTNDARIRQALGRVQQNALKMNQMIDDLLAFSKLGRKPLQTTAVDMTQLVEMVLHEIKTQQNHQAKIVLHKLHPTRGDHALLAHVWTNLISNAIKYSGKKESPLVEISSAEVGGEVVYAVKDNGAGFSMDYASRLFGVFQRLHKSSEFEGTGVGLAIVHRIVGRHGGRIWAEAKDGEGATFYFTLGAAQDF
ncbi:sensor histidine kinase [Chryseolinea lacunae]|uniref:histidine kinase n=1 Tax=Chryseolinea lacunae TaxID=2801331 RepID=A0ABS1KMS5_9BACT|nr:ATP-binding protein [Chryseolinea lacunae]MBL0740778.1 response regulator [Chryseolinea lacunae]